jgi:two-component system LytT family sensor kinase
MSILKVERPGLHVLIWGIFISYERIASFIANGRFANLWNYIAAYPIDIAFFYVNACVVFPIAYKKSKSFSYRLPLMITAEISVYILYKYAILYLFGFLGIPYAPKFSTHGFFISLYLFRSIFLLGLSIGYWFALTTFENQKRIEELERSQLQNQLEHQELEKTLLIADNAYLKSQINPHFILNTLNFLYNSVSKFSDKVADSVMTLSEIMRYALTNAGEDGKVRLEDEIEHVANFIKLNQARFSQRLRIEYLVKGEPGELRIIPLVLITLVENLFKYGDLLNEADPAKIIVNIEGNELEFLTKNVKKKNVREKGHGIGLKNITERLKMYHDHDLKIEENEHFYSIALTIRR